MVHVTQHYLAITVYSASAHVTCPLGTRHNQIKFWGLVSAQNPISNTIRILNFKNGEKNKISYCLHIQKQSSCFEGRIFPANQPLTG